MTDIEKIFKEHTGHLRYDKKLYAKLKKFRLRWMNKSETHIDFLSSNLIGVHPIRFTKEDEREFFDDLLDVDEKDLEKAFFKLDDIYKERKVTSNVFYLTIVCLMHEFIMTPASDDNKNLILTELYLIFSYKVFSSLISHRFGYNLDEDTAHAVFESLSNRYLIKSKGSWEAVFEYRARDVLLKDGLHVKKLTNLTAMNATLVISDLQGRLRSIVNEQVTIVYELKEENIKRVSSSLNSMDSEGNDVISEVTNLNHDYYTFIKHIVHRKEDFIKDDLIEICSEMFKNLKVKEFRKTLDYLCDLSIDDPTTVNDILDTTLKASINYLYVTKMYPPYDKRITSVIRLLRGYWSSSKVSDKHLLEVKEKMKDITKKGTGRSSKWLLVNISLVLPIYIFIRAIVKNKYK